MQAEGKRVIDALLADLRSLSTEAKKKQNHVKEAAETAVVKVRNISSASPENALLQNLRAASSELLHPLTLACGSKQSRLVQIALSAIQRMVQHRIIEQNCAATVVNELWQLMEAECEELRVLQTLTPLVSTELLVNGHALARCIVTCFRLRFAKDPVVINAASAAVRQIVSCVFERVVQEDGMKSSRLSVVIDPSTSGDLLAVQSRAPPHTLRPCAADAYMLFKDLCLLIDGEAPVWLSGLHEMSRTLGLELLESILHAYPSIFFKHDEFSRLLRDIVCPLIIRLFSPNIKNQMGSLLSSSSALAQARALAASATGSPDRTNFPMATRLVRVIVVLINNYHQKLATESEIFLSQLLRFLDPDKQPWQRALALEALHRLLSQPHVILWLCANYDHRSISLKESTGSPTPVLRQLVSGVASFVRQAFVRTHLSSGDDDNETGQQIGLPGFFLNGVWIPLVEGLTAKKGILSECLDKMEAAALPEGYCVSRAFSCLCDTTQAVFIAVDNICQLRKNGDTMNSNGNGVSEQQDENSGGAAPSNLARIEHTQHLDVALFSTTQPSLLGATRLLLTASTDETVTESLLACMSTLTLLSCRLKLRRERHAHLYALATAALPHCPGGYVASCMGIQPPREFAEFDGDLLTSLTIEGMAFQQVVAMGTPCPTPCTPAALVGQQMMLTTKNVQCARVLLTAGQACLRDWADSWHMLLAAAAHVAWLLAMRPSTTGGTFVRGSDDGAATSTTAGSSTNAAGGSAGNSGGASGGSSGNGGGPQSALGAATVAPQVGPSSGATVTTAAMSDIPVVAAMLDKLLEGSRDLDEVGVHHVVAALAKLSSEALVVSQHGREPSFFGVAKLLHVGMVNLERADVIWRAVTAHLLEVCAHSYAPLREWAALALTSLIRAALRSPTKMEEVKRQQMVMQPLSEMSEITLADVRKRQIECLMAILQSDGSQMKPPLWQTNIAILAAVVSQPQSCTPALITLSYTALRLIATDFIQVLPVECVQQLVEADALYGRQQADQNIALSALAQLWTISDFVFRRCPVMGADSAERIWVVLYTCLSELCVDSRPAVRKSAGQTLLQTVAAHGHVLSTQTWSHMIWQIILPMLDKVRLMTRQASKVREESALLVHHSRDTAAKQWSETSIHSLQGTVKIFNNQRSALLKLADFGAAWTRLLEYLEWATAEDNAELSLAALKCLHELLLGRAGAQTLDINTITKTTNSAKETTMPVEEPQLKPELWIVSWQSWMRMARSLTLSRAPSSFTASSGCPGTKSAEPPLPYLAGPSHLTTLLHIFPALFERVRHELKPEELSYQGVPGIFEAIVCTRVPVDSMPFVLPSSQQQTPTQAAVLECTQTLYAEMSSSDRLRSALPDLIRLLLRFASLSIRPPAEDFVIPNRDYSEWALSHLLPFAECCMRLSVDFYSATAAFPENVQAGVVIDIVKCLAEPMALKYQCLSASTWKLAAASLLNVLRIALPIARPRGEHFVPFWPAVAEALERFLFTPNVSNRLSPEERRRDEFIDCQFIELLRNDVLPYAMQLPSDFVQRVIHLLNRGSISQLDATDVLASDSFSQRADLARACFDALLSMTREEQQSQGGVMDEIAATLLGTLPKGAASLGHMAIASLLERCKQVMSLFVRDWRSSGDLRLPRARILELISALRAVDALIERLSLRKDAPHSDLYSQLVLLYPSVVELVQCAHADQEVESSLMASLKSYQTLLLLKTLPDSA